MRETYDPKDTVVDYSKLTKKLGMANYPDSKIRRQPMTHEKVLELLNTIKYCDVDERAKVWAIDAATEAIKKQIPMKPNVHEEEYITDFKCPKCGCRLLSRTVGKHVAGSCYPYCFMCGQHIDWEGVR